LKWESGPVEFSGKMYGKFDVMFGGYGKSSYSATKIESCAV